MTGGVARCSIARMRKPLALIFAVVLLACSGPLNRATGKMVDAAAASMSDASKLLADAGIGLVEAGQALVDAGGGVVEAGAATHDAALRARDAATQIGSDSAAAQAPAPTATVLHSKCDKKSLMTTTQGSTTTVGETDYAEFTVPGGFTEDVYLRTTVAMSGCVDIPAYVDSCTQPGCMRSGDPAPVGGRYCYGDISQGSPTVHAGKLYVQCGILSTTNGQQSGYGYSWSDVSVRIAP